MLLLQEKKDSIIKRTVRQDGQRAVTHYKAIKSGKKYSLIEIKLETGRTHQIRVHFAYIGHPSQAMTYMEAVPKIYAVRLCIADSFVSENR